MWIKICGNTNLEDAQQAIECGADALGFVFASSPRQVTYTQAERIVSRLPSHVETYGVFVDESFSGIIRAVTECGLTGVQFHGSSDLNGSADLDADADLAARLRERFAGIGRKVKIVRVLGRKAAGDRVSAKAKSREAKNGDAAVFDRELARIGGDPAVDAVLVDSFTAKAQGGTGTSFDWIAAQASFLGANPLTRLIVAGGLRPENVRAAISVLRPWGVDVVSGVEEFPGKKSRARIEAFIREAREAELSGHPAVHSARES